MKRPLIALACAAFGALAVIGASPTPAPAPTPGPIAFTADQAYHGRTLYIEHCAECHGGDLGGHIGPALAGPKSRTQYETGKYVYTYFTTTMPHGAPGVLAHDEYVDIMAFLYQQTGHKPGKTKLTAQAIDNDTTTLGQAQ